MGDGPRLNKGEVLCTDSFTQPEVVRFPLIVLATRMYLKLGMILIILILVLKVKDLEFILEQRVCLSYLM